MPYIATIGPDEAEGPLAGIYAAAIARAGKVFGILAVQSLNPAVLAASLGLYRAIMFGPSPLSRVERESIAVVVSRCNECFY